MKAAAFELAVAPDLAGVLAQLATPDAKPLAGNQSLGPMLNLRLARPSLLVGLSGIAELQAVTDEGDAVRYGAGVTHARIEDGMAPDATPGWLRGVASRIAYRAVRNRGTIGGSLAHADPAADWLVALSALGASVIVAGPAGRRSVAMPGFITGPFATGLAQGEIIVAVRVPKPHAAARWGYWKFTRKIGEFAKASAAVLLDPHGNRIAVGALEQPPVLLGDAALGDPEAALQAALPGRDIALHAVAVRRAVELARA